jgi:geranylgeranylglycerol-phosphate geranylgeranyltransferase
MHMTTTLFAYQLTSLAQITRWTNSVYAGTYTLIGAFLAGGLPAASSGHALRAALVVGLVVAYGFVINDLRDVLVDSIGKPHRPIPAGRISRRDALWLALALAALALLLAWSLGPSMALFAFGTITLAAVYSYALKSTILVGNACMGLLIGAIPLYGSLSTGRIPLEVWVVAGLMWLFDWSHEILKTTADWQGDGAAGLRTVATAFGVGNAVRIFQLVALFFLAVAMLPLWLGLGGWPYVAALLPCAILPTLAVVIMLRDVSDKTITRALRVMRWMWISNLVPILLLGMAQS